MQRAESVSLDTASEPPREVYVLIRDDGTIAGVCRDPFEPPNHSPSWRVVAYAYSAGGPTSGPQCRAIKRARVVYPDELLPH